MNACWVYSVYHRFLLGLDYRVWTEDCVWVYRIHYKFGLVLKNLLQAWVIGGGERVKLLEFSSGLTKSGSAKKCVGILALYG